MESDQDNQTNRANVVPKREAARGIDADHLAETAESLKQSAAAALDTVKGVAVETGEREKNYAAERMGDFAKAVHGAADQLHTQLPGASGYIHEAAAGLERASTTLHDSSIEDVLGAFTKLARQQPALLFGGAVLAGISLSRFLKSSAPGQRREARQRGDFQ